MKKIKGFNLVELLIALIVVSVALFGVAKLQINGMHGMESAKMTTSSVVNVASLIERLSKQRDEIKVYLDTHAKFSRLKNNNTPEVDACNVTDTTADANKAGISINCEIDAWVSAAFKTLNLQNSTDICYAVNISYDDNYSYNASMMYAIPRITVALKWQKIPGVGWDNGGGGCSVNDSGLMTVPNADSDVGYMSMEYIAP